MRDAGQHADLRPAATIHTSELFLVVQPEDKEDAPRSARPLGPVWASALGGRLPRCLQLWFAYLPLSAWNATEYGSHPGRRSSWYDLGTRPRAMVPLTPRVHYGHLQEDTRYHQSAQARVTATFPWLSRQQVNGAGLKLRRSSWDGDVLQMRGGTRTEPGRVQASGDTWTAVTHLTFWVSERSENGQISGRRVRHEGVGGWGGGRLEEMSGLGLVCPAVGRASGEAIRGRDRSETGTDNGVVPMTTTRGRTSCPRSEPGANGPLERHLGCFVLRYKRLQVFVGLGGGLRGPRLYIYNCDAL